MSLFFWRSDEAMHSALLGECVKIAEIAGPNCPADWNGVQWISKVLALMEFDGPLVSLLSCVLVP